MTTLKETYYHEINEISYILKQLEEERIYYPGKFTNNRNDGSLQHNVAEIRKKLNDLFNKIENNKPSDSELIDELFTNND